MKTIFLSILFIICCVKSGAGPCNYPDDLDSAGRRCGKRAASVRYGGRLGGGAKTQNKLKKYVDVQNKLKKEVKVMRKFYGELYFTASSEQKAIDISQSKEVKQKAIDISQSKEVKRFSIKSRIKNKIGFFIEREKKDMVTSDLKKLESWLSTQDPTGKAELNQWPGLDK